MFRIFYAERDATLFEGADSGSVTSLMNTGLDEILEVGKRYGTDGSSLLKSRNTADKFSGAYEKSGLGSGVSIKRKGFSPESYLNPIGAGYLKTGKFRDRQSGNPFGQKLSSRGRIARRLYAHTEYERIANLLINESVQLLESSHEKPKPVERISTKEATERAKAIRAKVKEIATGLGRHIGMKKIEFPKEYNEK